MVTVERKVVGVFPKEAHAENACVLPLALALTGLAARRGFCSVWGARMPRMGRYSCRIEAVVAPLTSRNVLKPSQWPAMVRFNTYIHLRNY